jgi:hypothetical protein
MEKFRETFENDLLIKRCILKDKASKQKFVENTSEYIITYPVRTDFYKFKYIYDLNLDNEFINKFIQDDSKIDIDEFYLVVLEKIRSCKVFSNFNKDVKFKTYFDGVLKFTMFSVYSAHKKSKSKYSEYKNYYNQLVKKKETDAESPKNQNIMYIEQNIEDPADNDINNSEKLTQQVEKFNQLLNLHLKIKDRIIYKLVNYYCFDLSGEEKVFLCKLSCKPPLEIAEILTDFRKISFQSGMNRVPLSEIAKLLKSTENAISLRLFRIKEKLNKYKDEIVSDLL